MRWVWGLEIWFGLSVRRQGLCIEEEAKGLLKVKSGI